MHFYGQLIAAAGAAWEQLFSFAVTTRVVTGRLPVLGSIVGDRRDSVALMVSTPATVAALALKLTGSVMATPGRPWIYAETIFGGFTPGRRSASSSAGFPVTG